MELIEVKMIPDQHNFSLSGELLKYAGLLFVVNAVVALFFILTSPFSLQKSLSIQQNDVRDVITDADARITGKGELFDIRLFLGAIPYNDNPKMVYAVLPKSRYQKTVIEGDGNCSNLVFGVAYYLLKKQHDFQVVHFIPVDFFMNGDGHTVLNTYYSLDGVGVIFGVVDVFEGGIPSYSGQPVTLNQLLEYDDDITIMPLTSLKDNVSLYYTREFLQSAVIGVVSSEDISDYFHFIEKIYVPILSQKAEKYVYDSISLLFGRFPVTKVSPADYERLFQKNAGILVMAKIWVWSGRLFLALFISGSLLSLLVKLTRLSVRYCCSMQDFLCWLRRGNKF